MLAFHSDVRPTPTQQNGNAEAMRAVPQYEPRTVVGNAVSPWERYATEVGGNGYCNAEADPGDPLFYAPATLAVIGGDYGAMDENWGYEGAPTADTHYRMVSAKGMPAFLRGTMSGFLNGLGDDTGGLSDDFFAGLSESPSLPTDSSGLPTGFFSGASASPLAPSSSIYYSNPAAPVLANDLTFAPPTISVPSGSLAAPSTATSAQVAQAQAVTALAAAGGTITKAALTPGAPALTSAQAAALAAQNPLNQIVPGLNMSVGTLLLMGGVLIGGALLISKIR